MDTQSDTYQATIFGRLFRLYHVGYAKRGPGKHGRFVLRVGDHDSSSARLEYDFPAKRFGLGVKFDTDEDAMQLTACVPPLSLYATFDGEVPRLLAMLVEDAFPADVRPLFTDRDFSVSVFDHALWWNFGVTRMGSPNTRPRWKDGSWRPLGHDKVQSERLLERRPVLVRMPEKSYSGTAELLACTHGFDKLPRFLDRKFTRVSIQMDEGIPVPGKGENSWDQDQDATFGVTMPARSIEAAVLELAKDVRETRERRAGPRWKPEPRTEVQA